MERFQGNLETKGKIFILNRDTRNFTSALVVTQRNKFDGKFAVSNAESKFSVNETSSSEFPHSESVTMMLIRMRDSCVNFKVFRRRKRDSRESRARLRVLIK